MPTAFDQFAPAEPESLPAMTGVDHDIRISANTGRRVVEMSHGREDGLHYQSHRIPAPTERASDASSISAQVKRARFAFTVYSFSMKVRHSWIGGRAFSLRRSLALRPRLATGLPWTIGGVERQSSLEDDGGEKASTIL
jgi:hypothetical protein